jgi:preprotein translocase subunit SecD
LLLLVGATALAGCGSSGSVKTTPGSQSSSAPASVTGSTSRNPSTAATSATSAASPHLTGPVTFRPVLWDSSQGAAPAPSAGADDLAATSADGKTKYILGPTAVSGTHVRSAEAEVPQGVWQIQVTLDSAGAKEFGDLTSSLAGTGKLIAIAVGDTVISAPTVQAAITDGKIQISGGFDRDKAEDLAAALTAGAKG